MIMTENTNSGCSQRDSAEHEGYGKASRSFNRIWKERDSAQPRLLEAILYKDNFNRAAYKQQYIPAAISDDGTPVAGGEMFCLVPHPEEVAFVVMYFFYSLSRLRFR